MRRWIAFALYVLIIVLLVGAIIFAFRGNASSPEPTGKPGQAISQTKEQRDAKTAKAKAAAEAKAKADAAQKEAAAQAAKVKAANDAAKAAAAAQANAKAQADAVAQQKLANTGPADTAAVVVASTIAGYILYSVRLRRQLARQ